MPYKERPIEKRYYSIGEVAQIFGVATSLIRFWQEEFEIIHPKKNKKGHRVFSKEDIDNVKIVYHLVKEKGYTLEGAKEVIKGEHDKLQNKLRIIASLERIKGFLNNMKSELDERLNH